MFVNVNAFLFSFTEESFWLGSQSRSTIQYFPYIFYSFKKIKLKVYVAANLELMRNCELFFGVILKHYRTKS